MQIAQADQVLFPAHNVAVDAIATRLAVSAEGDDVGLFADVLGLILSVWRVRIGSAVLTGKRIAIGVPPGISRNVVSGVRALPLVAALGSGAEGLQSLGGGGEAADVGPVELELVLEGF